MARAGMTRWKGRNNAGTEAGDDVEKSLELLDKVLSEFDDLENGNLGGETRGSIRAGTLRNSTAGRSESLETTGNVSSTPEDDSPSLGHQSEDDGYMSMNGSRAKFVLSFRPVLDESGYSELPPAPDPPPDPPPEEIADFPPPPEEAERIISNVLPKVSPVNSNKKSKLRNNHSRFDKPYFPSATLEEGIDRNTTTATQTTLPKTRHQRPFGWENDTNQIPLHLQFPAEPQNKYSSLPYEGALYNSRYPPLWLQKPEVLPPRTLPCALDKHREVKRQNSKEITSTRKWENENPTDDQANFSDDSLEEPIQTKRRSVAWEVPLGFEDEDLYLTPGSTKVIGRRRKKSGELSSNSSIHKLKEVDDWPEPPPSTEDEPASPYSDSFYDSNDTEDFALTEALPLDLTFNGTYVIRKGRKKEKMSLQKTPIFQIGKPPTSSKQERHQSPESKKCSQTKQLELKRTSSTFDNIKSLLKERLIEGLNNLPPDFTPPNSPKIVRVVSLPSLPLEEPKIPDVQNRNSKCERFSKLNELGVTLEEAEEDFSSLDNPSLNQELEDCKKIKCDKESVVGVDNELEASQKVKKECHEVQTQTDLSDTEAEQNELELVGKQIPEISKTKSELEEVEKKIQEIVKIKTVMEKKAREEEYSDPWLKVSDIEQPKIVSVYEEKPPDEFRVNVEILQHEFGPLPPSPVDEDDEEYSDTFQPVSAQSTRGKTEKHSESFYRSQEPPGSDRSGKYISRPPEPLPHGTSDSAPINSIFRSMEIGFRTPRGYPNGSKKENTTERRTLPSEFSEPISRRRTFQKRSSTLPQENTLTSCSLPETPIFTRGCDIPRTPHRRDPDTVRPGGLQSSSYRRNGVVTNSSNSNTCYKNSMPGGLNQAMVGAELLRLAGGPGRGWYPRHRQHRPASIEQLDRLPHSESGQGNGVLGAWDFGSSRKPMTLPPNITPKFFHRSPREALRRVTSLLIRGKGSTSKDKKEVVPPSSRFGDAVEQPKQKKGFWNFWKRSRHYSLDHQ